MERRVTAFVLAVVTSGREYDVLEELMQKKQVKEVYITYGEWDLVIKVEVGSLQELDAVVTEIRKIEGIRRTSTLIAR